MSTANRTAADESSRRLSVPANLTGEPHKRTSPTNLVVLAVCGYQYAVVLKADSLTLQFLSSHTRRLLLHQAVNTYNLELFSNFVVFSRIVFEFCFLIEIVSNYFELFLF